MLDAGDYVEAIIDTPDPDAKPIPRPDVRRMLVPIGPVAVFGASNFPLAFSTAGGDTASALAAGCPVVVKGHPSHPGTGELVARELRAAVADAGLPDGTFAHLLAAGVEVGEALVDAPAIAAVGFTGSTAGGRAIFDRAARRPVPIPVYAEMGSINPIVVTDAALAARADAIADGLVASVSNFGGQLCTKPGVVFVPGGRAGRRVRAGGRRAARRASSRPCCSTSACATRSAPRVERLAARPEVARARQRARRSRATASATSRPPTRRPPPPSPRARRCSRSTSARSSCCCATPTATSCSPRWRRSRASSPARSTRSRTPTPSCSARCPSCSRRAPAGVVYDGFPTGVAVTHGMHHGGPYPATSAPAHTSVGMTAMTPLPAPGRVAERARGGAPAGAARREPARDLAPRRRRADPRAAGLTARLTGRSSPVPSVGSCVCVSAVTATTRPAARGPLLARPWRHDPAACAAPRASRSCLDDRATGSPDTTTEGATLPRSSKKSQHLNRADAAGAPAPTRRFARNPTPRRS